ncbi:ABC transporter ATP-binding protein [Nitratireductor alexandrii]|uniref:ABC transporter ATP-binding protein n=1 Tax=Nitratireductor alexandrii TaxID=2448161 RepID=UPI001EE8948E|nr:dipeptide ABC transporter ATP-binding protein [Nitratireductor alexandrii]
MTEGLLEVRDLSKTYTISQSLITRRKQVLRAVDGVSFSLKRGETLALVGESGCGKSTTARLAMRLIEPSAGTVRFDGSDIGGLRGAPLRRFRRHMQIIFQDPFASLNPGMTVWQTLEEPLIVNDLGNQATRRARIDEVMRQVGLAPEYAGRYPHEFSGGQRQRIGIARALIVRPQLVVCDEPVSALDVSIQAQVINLLGDLQAQLGLSYLFISHDLAVVKHISDRVAVMYLGKIIETAPKRDFFAMPRHPYSRALLSAIPQPNPRERLNRMALSGEIPNPIDLPQGCRFHPRCPFAVDRCRKEEPTLAEIGTDAAVACHRAADLPDWEGSPDPLDILSPAARRRVAAYAARTRQQLPTIHNSQDASEV